MTVYYVRKSGNDGAAGTSPATAWLTIGKALGAAGISSGDTVYIGAGVYREKVTCALTSPVTETFVIGDVDGSQTGDAGEIRITNHLTNDKTAATAQSLVDLNGADHLTFQKIMFQQTLLDADLNTIDAIHASGLSQYISFHECAFNVLGYASDSHNDTLFMSGTNDTPLHFLLDKCVFLSLGGPDGVVKLSYEATTNTVDFDADCIITNCVFYGGGPIIQWVGSGDWADHLLPAAGGLIVRNCTFFGNDGSSVVIFNQNASTPAAIVHNNLFIPGAFQYGISALFSHINAVDEDYNLYCVYSGNIVENVTLGANSISDGSYAPLLHFCQELQQGLILRPFLMPTADSPLLGFGDDGNAPAVDSLNRTRPAGGQSTSKAVGAYERHDTGAKEITVVDSSPASVKIVGPGDHDLYIPVDATETTISIKARYDANHAATNKPQAILLAAPEIGISAETKTMTAAANTWETLTFTPFTPTAKGVVKLRIISRSAAGNGIAYFDTANIA